MSFLSSTPTPTFPPSSSRHRLLLPPARSSFSRIPIESLDYDRASDNDRRRRRARRRRHDDEEEEEDEDEEEDDDGERRKRSYSDASFNDDEDASGLEPGFPGAALPGSQVARLKDLAAQSSLKRDIHWRFYKAHSAKSNLLSAIVLACTTAGGTSGLISLTQAAASSAPPSPSGGFSGLVPDASTMFHGMTSAAAQAAREAAAASAAAAAAAAANANNSAPSSNTAALLSPILGYAATLVSGLQNYSKPSTAASRSVREKEKRERDLYLRCSLLSFFPFSLSLSLSRALETSAPHPLESSLLPQPNPHLSLQQPQKNQKPKTKNRHLTAYKRYQVISRHCRDALRYGSVRSYARVIHAVERKLDQYEDESPTIPDLEPDEEGKLPRPPGPVEAFFTAMTEVPE